MHARTKLRAAAENFPGNSGIGFDSDPMQKIAAVGAMSALHTTINPRSGILAAACSYRRSGVVCVCVGYTGDRAPQNG